MQERDAWLGFSHVRGMGAVRFRKLLQFFLERCPSHGKRLMTP